MTDATIATAIGLIAVLVGFPLYLIAMILKSVRKASDPAK
jgi:hypothetical protein